MVEVLEGNIIGVPASSPTAILAIFINTYTGDGVAQYPPNQWNTVDLSNAVPDGTVAVCLSGLVLITHGTNQESANLTIAFRDHQDFEYGYNMQAVEVWSGGGERSNASTWIALGADKKFQFKWTRTPSPGNWPDWSSYGVNLSVSAYIRQGQADAQVSQLMAEVATLSQAVAALQAVPPGSDSRLTDLINYIKDEDC